MKKLGFTQRVEHIASYGERRDCLDQRWNELALALDYLPIPLPNLPAESAAAYADQLGLSAVILTGGNSLSHLDPTAPDAAPERDAFEAALVDWALQKDTPLVGICRGLQLINHFFGGALEPLENHIAVRHPVQFCGRLENYGQLQVNSYHAYGVRDDTLAPSLSPLAYHEDGSIEAFEHEEAKITALMWHPEREEVFQSYDIQILSEVLR